MPLVSPQSASSYTSTGTPLSPYTTTTLLQLLLTLLTSLNILQQTFATFRLLRLDYSYQPYLLQLYLAQLALADIQVTLTPHANCTCSYPIDLLLIRLYDLTILISLLQYSLQANT